MHSTIYLDVDIVSDLICAEVGGESDVPLLPKLLFVLLHCMSCVIFVIYYLLKPSLVLG